MWKRGKERKKLLLGLTWNVLLYVASLAWLATKGITLENYFAQTHPSEPNYVASHGGDYFGMDNDKFNFIDSNVSTIVDLLETKGISWAEYQEDMPYTGFEGNAWVNQETGANDCECFFFFCLLLSMIATQK